jgi:uncharacterized membrane protein required for colicin V production
MDAVHATGMMLPLVDWIAIGLCLAGVLLGLRTGLGRSFALMLWLLAALWLGTNLSATIVGWMPNTSPPNDPHAQLITFGIVAGVVLFVPVLGRLLGGAAGKKKKDKAPPTHKPFGALVGLFNAVLFLTLLLPFLTHLDAVAKDLDRATAPRWAADFAGHMTYLYPAVHHAALLGATGAAPAVGAAGAAGAAGEAGASDAAGAAGK